MTWMAASPAGRYIKVYEDAIRNAATAGALFYALADRDGGAPQSTVFGGQGNALTELGTGETGSGSGKIDWTATAGRHKNDLPSTTLFR
jgi:hypothetical protein